jgi:hypothetical protein
MLRALPSSEPVSAISGSHPMAIGGGRAYRRKHVTFCHLPETAKAGLAAVSRPRLAASVTQFMQCGRPAADTHIRHRAAERSAVPAGLLNGDTR